MPTLQLASLKELSVPVPDELDAEKMRDAVDAEARLQAAIEKLKRKQTALSAEFGASYDRAARPSSSLRSLSGP
ncbi:MAG: hypothetical protein JHD19_25765 [Pseudomonas sp.]|uniref:hypothetical protein n=1 Tax=Pseudomonas sp. TaxID=306 RepID=UPI001A1D3A05|nr:hypothetical protein [Pseudomonas sp.]MBJ7374880.1 hypothetical protein [Pseudomonas sp.]